MIREAQQPSAEQPEAAEEMPAISEKSPEITADLKENKAQTPSETMAEEISDPETDIQWEDENEEFEDEEEFKDKDSPYFGFPDSGELPYELDRTILPQLFQKLRIPMPQAPPG